MIYHPVIFESRHLYRDELENILNEQGETIWLTYALTYF